MCTSPSSVIRIAPSPAMEMRTFLAPFSWSFFPYSMISSLFFSSTPNISPNSWLFGLIRNGWYFRTFNNKSFVASTTIWILRSWSLSIIFSYTSSGRVFGILPARTNISPSFNVSSFWYIISSSSSWISGPCPLISLSSFDLILTLILVMPSLRRIKSGLNPSCFAPVSMASPVKPAINPNPTLSIPKLASTFDTLIPLPPQYISSLLVRFTFPRVRSSTLMT